MNPLLAPLFNWLGDRTATVVHLGAGSGALLDAYASVSCRRLVLVEGDPDLAGALASRAAPLDGVEVHARALAADAGHVLWNRYNLRALNGPLDAMALRNIYPRLQSLSALPLPTTAIADWLRSLALGRDDGPRVLVVDLPGQEDRLLGAVDDEQLWAFDAVLLRGCGHPPGEGWDAAAAAEQRLGARWFRPGPEPAAQDPLWPVRLLVQDRSGRVEALAAAALAGERAARAVAEAERDAAAAARDAAKDESAGHQARLGELAAQIEALRHERDQEAHWHQENARWAQGLKAQLESLTAERDALQADRNALAERQAELQAELQAECDRQAARGNELQAECDRQAARADDLQSRLETLRQERDQEAHWHQENAKWAQGLKGQVESLTAERDALQAAQAERDALQAAQAEHQTETQAGRQAELEAECKRQAARADELQARVEALRQERDHEAHWHQENAKWAQGLKAETEALTRQLAAADEERGVLRARIAERDERQRLLDAEILRAEAQLDLIKDVLLREKNF